MVGHRAVAAISSRFKVRPLLVRPRQPAFVDYQTAVVDYQTAAVDCQVTVSNYHPATMIGRAAAVQIKFAAEPLLLGARPALTRIVIRWWSSGRCRGPRSRC